MMNSIIERNSLMHGLSIEDTTERMDFIVRDLGRRFRMTREDVEKEICPEYDLMQRCNHSEIDFTIRDYEFSIDEKLVDLIKLMNHFEFTTQSSCQHDWFGWTSITFDSETYNCFVKNVIDMTIRKYGEKSIESRETIYRFMFDTSEKQSRVTCRCFVPCGETEARVSISIRFLQCEIGKLVDELTDIFCVES